MPAGTQGAAGATPGRPPPDAPAARDRLAVHLVWEAILLLAAIALVGYALATTHQAHFADVVRPAGYLGLVACGLALSLRTGTPNLAVGSIAGATGVFGAHFATTDGWPLWGAMIAAVALAGLTGLITGLVVGVLSVPAWAATLALVFLLQAAAFGISRSQPITLHITGSYPTALWLAIFAVASIGGGGLWLIPAVRTALSATRNAGEPGRWAGMPAGLGAVAGLTGSSLLAGAGGVALATYLTVGDAASGGIDLTIFALAAVLAGGVSVFGRRAGVFGTVLGVVIVATVLFIVNAHGVGPYWLDAFIGGVAVLGLGVSRAIEGITDALNRPRTVPPGFAGPAAVPPPGPAAP